MNEQLNVTPLSSCLDPSERATTQALRSVQRVFDAAENIHSVCLSLVSLRDCPVETGQSDRSLSLFWELSSWELTAAPRRLINLLEKYGLSVSGALRVGLTFVDSNFEDRQNRLEIAFSDKKGREFSVTTDEIGELICSLNYDWQNDLAEGLNWLADQLKTKAKSD